MSRGSFKDHFSGHAALYSQYRPDYPADLYAFLARQTPAHHTAWDCATGSGQAAMALTGHFEQVIATDASASQLENASQNGKVDYRVSPAEASGLDEGSVDLITVAQALHWFDLQAFYAEVERVLKPGGVLAIWSYNLLRCSPEIDALLYHYYSEIVGPYWPPERIHIENGYRNLPFPYAEESSPDFAMIAEWSLEQLLGYLGTWSATQRYTKEIGADPIALIRNEITRLWGDTPHRTITWPLNLRWGRKNASAVI